jgi:hypothetical protein
MPSRPSHSDDPHDYETHAYEAHAFDPEPGASRDDAHCRVCGERWNYIQHHPTRIRAARLLHGHGDAPRRASDGRSQRERR